MKDDSVWSQPVNTYNCRMMVTWEWSARGIDDAVATAALGCFQRWEKLHHNERDHLRKILAYDVSGTPLGLLQASALVQWNSQGRLMRHVRVFTDVLRRRASYDGPAPICDNVRIRSGGGGVPTWQHRHPSAYTVPPVSSL